MKLSFSLAELAQELGGTLRGDPDIVITGLDSVQRASTKDITWVTGDKYAAQLMECSAAAVLVPSGFGATPMPAILCERMDESVGRLLALFAPPWPRPEMGIHPTAAVHASASVGANACLGPNVVVGARATIGDAVLHAGVHIGPEARVGHGSILWDHVVIRDRCVVGDRVILHPHVVIGGDGFGYYFAEGAHQKIAHGGTVVIEDDVEIGSGTTVDRGKFGATSIGRGTKIDNLVQIGHNVEVGPCCLIVAGVAIGGSVVLEAGVVIGGNTGIKEHCVLGARARVAAHSCVYGNVRPGAMVSGVPARDHRRQLRLVALTHRLPEMSRRLAELEERIENLEAATNHPQSG